MANSRFAYVKDFELDDRILPRTYIVVRVDGRGFTKFTAAHGYAKPNDVRGVALMVQCAAVIMESWGELVLAFGESDEFSFVFAPDAAVFGRRSSKLSSGIVSLFSSSFVYYWPKFFPTTPLLYPPSFDARCVAYPTPESAADYVCWRQVDTYINSMYNEAFWALIQRGAFQAASSVFLVARMRQCIVFRVPVLAGGSAPDEAHAALKGTLADRKHDIMFGLGINFAKVPAMYRRGSTLVREAVASRARAACAPTKEEDGASSAGTSSGSAKGPTTPLAGTDVAPSKARPAAADDDDAGVDCGPLAIPASIALRFPDFAKKNGSALLGFALRRGSSS